MECYDLTYTNLAACGKEETNIGRLGDYGSEMSTDVVTRYQYT